MSDEEYLMRKLLLAKCKLETVTEYFQECCKRASQQLEQVNITIRAIEKRIGQKEEGEN